MHKSSKIKLTKIVINAPYVIPANTKHLYKMCSMFDQRRKRRADVVQMLYKCFVFAGMQR